MYIMKVPHDLRLYRTVFRLVTIELVIYSYTYTLFADLQMTHVAAQFLAW